MADTALEIENALNAVTAVLEAANQQYWLHAVRAGLNETDPEGRAKIVMSWFHKDGLGDLYLTEMNGHDLSKTDYQSVNEHFEALAKTLRWAAQSEITRLGGI
jgi:hypothetical protein